MIKHYAFKRINRHPGFLTRWHWISWLRVVDRNTDGNIPVATSRILNEKSGYTLTKGAAKRASRRAQRHFQSIAAALDGR